MERPNVDMESNGVMSPSRTRAASADNPLNWAASPLTIRRIDAIPIALPLTKPFKMAGVMIAKAENLLVRIEAHDGTVGWGEAASAPTMTGDTLPGLVAAVSDHIAPALAGQDARLRPTLMLRLKAALYGNTGAKAAIDMALLDLIGRAGGVSFCELLGGPRRTEVRPMCLIGNTTTEQDLAEARVRRGQGYTFFKLKVGTKKLADDVATTHAMRDLLGPDAQLCADANQGFTRADAHRYLIDTRAAHVLFLEQPIAGDDIEGMAALARADVPLCADEGIHSVADIEAHARTGAAMGVSLKFIKLGGISELLGAAAVCKERGLAVNVASKIAESGIASAAVVHAGCVVQEAGWGVSISNIYLEEDIVLKPLQMRRDGTVPLPAGPGLGVEVDEMAVSRFHVR